MIEKATFVRAVKSEFYPEGTVAFVKDISGDLFIVAPNAGGAERWDRLSDWEPQEICRGMPLDHRWQTEASRRVFCTKCGKERK
jgi:hypothetical protein